VPVTTNVASSNPAQAKQHYVIMFVSDLRQVFGFHSVLRFPVSIKIIFVPYNWNIVESGVKHPNPNPINE
jgi:hypothetical protein